MAIVLRARCTVRTHRTATESMQNGFVQRRRRRFMCMEFICTGRNKERWHSMKEIIGSHDPGMKMKEEEKCDEQRQQQKYMCSIQPSKHPSPRDSNYFGCISNVINYKPFYFFSFSLVSLSMCGANNMNKMPMIVAVAVAARKITITQQ